MKRFTTLVWDNNDYSEETLSGKGSMHVVNGIVIQRGRDTAPAKKVFVSKKVRSVKAPEPIIQQYNSKKKGVPSLHEHKSELELRMNGHVSFQEHALRMDLAYLLCRVASSVCGNITHGWTGFNALCTASVPEASTIGYLPVIDNPATELATANELLKRLSTVSACKLTKSSSS